jgi:nicotinamide-nucleotide amidase
MRLEYEIGSLIRKLQSKTGKLVTIGTVESASGGRISDRITNVPGSSYYYKGSVISYSNEIKSDIIGVNKETLQKYGAVSRQTALEMSAGGMELLKVDICISTTGIAGPTGSTPQKPIGLFYISLSAADTAIAGEYTFEGTRQKNKRYATECALLLLKDYLIKRLKKANRTGPDERHVVTCFIEHENKILLLKRSINVGTFKNHWAVVCGYVEMDTMKQAFTEIKEEIGLDSNDVTFIRKGEPFEIVDEFHQCTWVIYSFLFHTDAPEKIRIDWEHTDMRWITPDELESFKTVPNLKKAMDSVL